MGDISLVQGTSTIIRESKHLESVHFNLYRGYQHQETWTVVRKNHNQFLVGIDR